MDDWLRGGIDLILGIGGTVFYLYLWNVALSSASPQPGDLNSDENKRRKRKRRLWQLVFFIGMTPYVLLLFYTMEQTQSLVQPEKQLPSLQNQDKVNPKNSLSKDL
tara:strand:- start:125 stop:442 length:318 start_codon:yes stop_codon:yes gene_type:complete